MLTLSVVAKVLPPFPPGPVTVDQDAKIRLLFTNIICIVKTAKDTQDTYIQSTTGIQVVQ